MSKIQIHSILPHSNGIVVAFLEELERSTKGKRSDYGLLKTFFLGAGLVTSSGEKTNVEFQRSIVVKSEQVEETRTLLRESTIADLSREIKHAT